jgi:hypothetical protein
MSFDKSLGSVAIFLKINISVIKYYTSITETAICMVVNLLNCCLFNDFISISNNIALSLYVTFLCDMQIKLKPKHVTHCIMKQCTGVVVIDCPSSPFLIWHWVRGLQVNNKCERNAERSLRYHPSILPEEMMKITTNIYLDVFLTMHHSINLFLFTNLMHNFFIL